MRAVVLILRQSQNDKAKGKLRGKIDTYDAKNKFDTYGVIFSPQKTDGTLRKLTDIYFKILDILNKSIKF